MCALGLKFFGAAVSGFVLAGALPTPCRLCALCCFVPISLAPVTLFDLALGYISLRSVDSSVLCVSHHENCYLLAIRGAIFRAILSFELFFCVLFVCYLFAICVLFVCYLRAIYVLSMGYPGAIHRLL